MQVNKILLPNKPQLDPIAAVYLLMQYGGEAYPGVSNAEIFYWEQSQPPSQDDVGLWEAEGGIMVDVGGGLFDHHNNENDLNQTATTLVAEHLGIAGNSELSTFINYIREDDLEGLHNRWGELPYIIKCMHKQSVPPFKVVEYAMAMIHYLHMVDRNWHHVVREEFESNCKTVKVKRAGRNLKIGIIGSDNTEVGKYGITANNYAVIIQKRSSGHVYILTNKHFRIDLRGMIALIRKRELELGGYSKPIDLNRLKHEGSSMILPQWYFHRSLNSFLNGTDALHKVEPTKVPFEEIVEIVVKDLTPESE